jgi:plastocyanin
MTLNAIRRAVIALISATASMLGFASGLEAAPAVHPSMSSIMYLGPAVDVKTIIIKDFHFSPVVIAIPAGTTVTWKNLDGEPRAVVSDDGLFRSGLLDRNDSFTFKFDTPGTYKFLCSINSRIMGQGTIIVE